MLVLTADAGQGLSQNSMLIYRAIFPPIFLDFLIENILSLYLCAMIAKKRNKNSWSYFRDLNLQTLKM